MLARTFSPAFAREIECSRAATSTTPDEIAESLVVLDRAASDPTSSGSPIIAQWAHTIAAELCVRQGDIEAALQHAEAALVLSADTGFAWSVGSARKITAIALGARDGWESAAPHFRLSFDAHMANGDIAGAATVVQGSRGAQPARGEPATGRPVVDGVPDPPGTFRGLACVR